MGFKRILRELYLRIVRGQVSTRTLERNGFVHGQNFDRHNGVIIDDSHPWLIRVGDNVEFAPRVHVLSHDTSTNLITGRTRLGFVEIGSNVFIGADSIILPNTFIGNNVVVGAGSVVSGTFPDNVVIAGNPARIITSYEEYSSRKKKEMSDSPSFDEKYTLRNPSFSQSERDEMIKKMKDSAGIAYVD